MSKNSSKYHTRSCNLYASSCYNISRMVFLSTNQTITSLNNFKIKDSLRTISKFESGEIPHRLERRTKHSL